MDNKTPEIDQPQENPQVRKEWIVPRYYRDHEPVEYEVIAADPTNLMISFPLHGGDTNEEGLGYNEEDYPYVNCGVAEYRFGKEGRMPRDARERIFSKSPGFTDLEEGEETDRYFSDFYEQYDGYLNSVEITKTVEYGELNLHFSNGKGADGYLVTFLTNKDEARDLGRRRGGLGSVQYDPSDGGLWSLRMGTVFERRENEDVGSPEVIIGIYENNQIRASIYPRHPDIGKWGGRRDFWGDESKTFSCLDNEGKGFDFTCRIENGSLVVSQTYFADGTVKIVRVPLILDPEELESNLVSDPPLNKNGVFDLEKATWRNFDRLFGASISYSYPSPKQN